MRAGPFVVRTIEGHQPLQARFVEHDHVIETFALSGSNKSLDEWILPRRVGSREHFVNPHRLCRGPEAVERMIAIVNQISRLSFANTWSPVPPVDSVVECTTG
jgi:hypothetical protein